ncbi:hypothetical protein B0O80DRAFT_475953, partial [Mortierella sp. GBAus27b]
TVSNCFKHCKIRSDMDSVPIVREDQEIITQLNASIHQLPYEDPMPIDVLLDYPEEQEVANEPSITELVEHEKQTRNEEEEEEEAGIELQSKLTAEQAVDIMEEVALFFMLLDHDTQEQIALANKL